MTPIRSTLNRLPRALVDFLDRRSSSICSSLHIDGRSSVRFSSLFLRWQSSVLCSSYLYWLSFSGH